MVYRRLIAQIVSYRRIPADWQILYDDLRIDKIYDCMDEQVIVVI
jgi:hypothetical protein